MRLGARLRSGEGIGWLAAGTIPNSLYRVPFSHLFLAYTLCYCSFFFCHFVLFLFCFVSKLSLKLCRYSSDSFRVQQITYRIGNHVYYWVWLRADWLIGRTQQQQRQILVLALCEVCIERNVFELVVELSSALMI